MVRMHRPSSIGRGQLRREIARCREDPLFHDQPGLRISWAIVDSIKDLDGVVAYLYQRLRPMWGEVVPWSEPLAINLPAA
jgi:hypothetical protein